MKGTKFKKINLRTFVNFVSFVVNYGFSSE